MSRPPGDALQRRRTFWAVVLSFLVAGLGHMLLGRLGRALVWFGGLMLILGIAAEADATTWQARLVLAALGAFAALDAVLIAREQNA